MLVAVIIRIVWLVLEIPHLRRSHRRSDENCDQNSGRVWDAAHLVETLGLVLAFWNVGHFELHYASIIGVCALIAGIIIRFAAIHTLGRFFASVVTIREDHEIIRTRPLWLRSSSSLRWCIARARWTRFSIRELGQRHCQYHSILDRGGLSHLC
jgi:isoprenylcysteine carboxyl methyltransferase (ICMT) family protein YpbQ